MGLRTHTALWVSGALLAFYLFGHYFIGPDPARVVITSLLIGAYLAVVLTWFNRAKKAVKGGVTTGTDNIHIGVWLNAFISLGYFIWVVAIIALDRPAWTRELPVGGIFTVGFFLSASALLLTPINTKEVLEPVSLRAWLISVAAGGVASGVVMTLAFLGIVNLNF